MRTARFEKQDRQGPVYGGLVNICGVAVHALPEKARGVEAALRRLPGVEVHAAADDGRFILTVEDTPTMLASAIINDMGLMPGVANVSLVYHHFEQPEALNRPVEGGITR